MEQRRVDEMGKQQSGEVVEHKRLARNHIRDLENGRQEAGHSMQRRRISGGRQ